MSHTGYRSTIPIGKSIQYTRQKLLYVEISTEAVLRCLLRICVVFDAGLVLLETQTSVSRHRASGNLPRSHLWVFPEVALGLVYQPLLSGLVLFL